MPGAAPDLVRRVRQFLSLFPSAALGNVQPSDFSMQLKSFFASYVSETHDKGYPLWHPLPFQFPDDPECANHADEFMLGDEMLIAPIYSPDGKRSLYLPPGIWTSLETNAVEQGRRTITVETPSLPVFARNGTIVPLDSANGMALHYFPDLAAEFFVLETEAGQWTQIHAAPAADIFRLEIESKVARAYQWAVHHVEKPSAVGFEERKYSEAKTLSGLADDAWFYDAAQKLLYVKVRVASGEDRVIHVTF
jgi:alpha-glucosidase (family GH31 glycosyl hydrolase)